MSQTKTRKRKASPSSSPAKKTTGRRTASQSRVNRARRPWLHPLHISITAIVAVAIGAGFFLAGFKAEKSDAANCTISSILVNSCRPWLSAAVGGYPQAAGDQQFEYFNKRLNNPNVLSNPSAATNVSYKVDVPHVYHTPGQTLLNSNAKRVLADTSLYSNPGNPVMVNWKPGNNWADTANGAADASIIESAKAVKDLGSRKIFLTLWHEPENDNVNAAGVNITGQCKAPNGTSGSAADYVRMWRHVRSIFDQQGVNNVVWFVNYTGFVGDSGSAGWACIIKDLYPGNNYVDWIMWDPYASGGDFAKSVSRFYDFLNANSDSTYNFKSKPWGLAEHGSNSSPSEAVSYWQQGKEAMSNKWATNAFPNIKLWSVFDTSNNGGVNGGLRVGYDVNGGIDTNEQAAFNGFAQHILNFSDTGVIVAPPPPPPPSRDTVPPTVNLSYPLDGSRHKGTLTVKGEASDNARVKAVTLRVNDEWVAGDESAPYTFRLDTTKYKDGKHTLTLRAWDPADNMGQSKPVTITIDNHRPGSRNEQTTAPKTKTDIVQLNTFSSAKSPLKANGTIIVTPAVAGSSVQVWVDGKALLNNVVETTWLTNGTHVIKIVENGETAHKYITVSNSLPLAALNHARANAVPYTAAAIGFVAILGLLFGRSYSFAGLISRRERQITKSQRSYRK